MIRISDPGRLGQMLGTLRITNGHSRVAIARAIAASNGRDEAGIKLSMWRWDTGRAQPDVHSLGHYLAALGYDLALIPREDGDEVEPEVTTPTAEDVADVLAIVDGPPRSDVSTRLEDE